MRVRLYIDGVKVTTGLGDTVAHAQEDAAKNAVAEWLKSNPRLLNREVGDGEDETSLEDGDAVKIEVFFFLFFFPFYICSFHSFSIFRFSFGRGGEFRVLCKKINTHFIY